MIDREQLLAERATGIGGSDIHHLFNALPYGCSRRLFYEKSGRIPDYPVKETAPMRRGQIMEAIAAQEWERDHPGQQLRHTGVRRGENDWALVHLDREMDDCIVEIKVPGTHMFYDIQRRGLADAYILQGQHGMAIAAKQRCLYIVFNAEAWRYVDFYLERRDDLITEINARGDEFWEMLQAGETPRKLDAGAPQCDSCPYRKTCRGDEWKPEPGEVSTYDAGLAEVLAPYQEAKLTAKEAAALLSKMQAQVEEYIGNRQILETYGAKVYFKWNKPGLKWETERLWEDFHKLQGVVLRVIAEAVADGREVRLTEDEKRALTLEPKDFKKETEPARPLRVYAR